MSFFRCMNRGNKEWQTIKLTNDMGYVRMKHKYTTRSI